MTIASAPGARRPLLSWLLTAVLVALLVSSLLLWLDQRRSLDSGVVATARQEAANFFGLDHRTAEADLDAVLALATGTFKSEYAAKRDTLAKTLVEQKIVMTATVPENGAAIEFEIERSAQVLVAVDVTTNGATNRYRARISLTKVDDTWLVSGVDQVG